jgi:AAA+ ATPase superfamily predicted ATPase
LLSDFKTWTTPQHYVILGPRRIGKTSLLLKIRQTIVEEQVGIPVYINCSFVGNETEFFQLIVTKTAESSKNLDFSSIRIAARVSDLEADISAKLSSKLFRSAVWKDFAEEVFQIIEGNAEKQKKPIILLIDEFPFLGPNFEGFLRTVLSKTKWVSFVITSSATRLLKITTNSEKPFYLFFKSITLGPFTEQETAELITRGSSKLDVQFDSLAIEEIHNLARGMPLYVQALLGECVTISQEKPRSSTVTQRTVSLAYNLLVQHLAPYFNTLIREMPLQQKKIIYALALGDNSPTQIASRSRIPVSHVIVNLKRLSEEDFVVKLPEWGKYSLRDRVFRDYIQRFSMVQ